MTVAQPGYRLVSTVQVQRTHIQVRIISLGSSRSEMCKPASVAQLLQVGLLTIGSAEICREEAAEAAWANCSTGAKRMASNTEIQPGASTGGGGRRDPSGRFITGTAEESDANANVGNEDPGLRIAHGAIKQTAAIQLHMLKILLLRLMRTPIGSKR
jgi:hypothetical protein